VANRKAPSRTPGRRPAAKPPGRTRTPPRQPPVEVRAARALAPAAADAESPPAALSSARSTISGPSAPIPGVPRDAPARKLASINELAMSMPHNANKASEYGPASAEPPIGVAIVPPNEEVGASTLTESNASEKLGGGVPPLSFNPTVGPLTRVRVDSSEQTLTTNQGVPIADNQHSLKGGYRGPALLEDFILREKITHFDHERIPERVVHARGSAAHGFFECYEPLTDITCASIFAEAGKRTPLFVRFSTVAGERGSPDTVRDARGFAVKFYTDQGNWDLVGNNIPVFFIQDAIKFPDLVHALKPEPHFAMPQASTAHDTFWDFVSLMPESVHMQMWIMSDRAVPRSFRMMQGFGVHTFRLVNQAGAAVFVKFHWSPILGTHSLDWDEAVKICGADPDFHRRDLWEAIEAGEYPEWELGLQIFTEAQADRFSFDVLDATKIVPEELVPIRVVGRMVLNRNPDNFFAETEQVAFCTAHIVPGIDFSSDPLLAGRIHSYTDTQLTRLGGPNFHEIPINTPVAQLHNNQRDGFHRQAINRGRVAYEPNSLAGGCPAQAGIGKGFTSFPEPVREEKVRGNPEKFADHYSQATLFYNSQSPIEQAHIIRAFRFELTRVQTPAIRARVVSQLLNVDARLAQAVAEGLGIELPQPQPLATSRLVKSEVQSSKALSLLARPGNGTIRTRRVAILVAPGTDVPPLLALHRQLLDLGAVPRFVSSRLGRIGTGKGEGIDVEVTIEAAPSVLWDGLVIPDGASKAEGLASDGQALEFVKDQYRHCKTILAIGTGADLLKAAQIPAELVDGKPDPGLLRLSGGKIEEVGRAFAAALALHRHFIRQTDPPRV